MRKILLVLALATSIFSTEMAAGTAPSVTFHQDSIQIHGSPETHIAWLTVAHQQRGSLMAVESLTGLAVSDSEGEVRLPWSDANGSRSIWMVADIGAGTGIHASPPGYEPSAAPVLIDAVGGRTTLSIRAAVTKLLYVRPGQGAWAFTGTDGGQNDGDGQQNSVVQIPLSAMQPVEGLASPPATIAVGDLILAVDSRWMRVGRLVVSQ